MSRIGEALLLFFFEIAFRSLFMSKTGWCLDWAVTCLASCVGKSLDKVFKYSGCFRSLFFVLFWNCALCFGQYFQPGHSSSLSFPSASSFWYHTSWCTLVPITPILDHCTVYHTHLWHKCQQNDHFLPVLSEAILIALTALRVMVYGSVSKAPDYFQGPTVVGQVHSQPF